MINVILKDLETGIHEQVVCRPWGYLICINSRDSYAMQRWSYLHALEHIMNHDFEKDDVQEIETERHA